ncbi:MAG: hypothetical protein Ct9H300mP28_37010 [Pseudomonadota bacterium]|nr:MAG: hypothetical protein Ct9H300mP28_37010 [Pseudomonadota bacterium]
MDQPYVSRGGVKLKSALEYFNIDPRGFDAMDIGSSTGGFTDCLIKSGAEKVFAVDVGYGQLAWELRQDLVWYCWNAQTFAILNLNVLDNSLTGGN